MEDIDVLEAVFLFIAAGGLGMMVLGFGIIVLAYSTQYWLTGGKDDHS